MRTFPTMTAKEGTLIDKCIISHPMEKFMVVPLEHNRKLTPMEEAIARMRSAIGGSSSWVEESFKGTSRAPPLAQPNPKRRKLSECQVEWSASPGNTQNVRRRAQPTVTARAGKESTETSSMYARWNRAENNKRKRGVQTLVGTERDLRTKGGKTNKKRRVETATSSTRESQETVTSQEEGEEVCEHNIEQGSEQSNDKEGNVGIG
jgi:hypothetical protein